MFIHDLKPNKQKKRKTVGRGNGSGHGTFSGRGGKGQKARSGGSKGLKGGSFEGGQTPLMRKMPKLGGFTNPNTKKYKAINFLSLEKHFKEGETVDQKSLYEKGLIKKRNQRIKILGKGKLTKKIIIALPISKQAAKQLKK
ncbi:50S ribosomal protein L15 [Candidatus Peregrinibacteria bacterium]|nr:50S ribosomal protein L15 [Candidatus Peregrinibacteria bacterium]